MKKIQKNTTSAQPTILLGAMAQRVEDEVLDATVNGNTATPAAAHPKKAAQHGPIFEKIAHKFAHRKRGAQSRFHRKYLELAKEVTTAWTADLLRMEEAARMTSKSNQALASTRLNREKEMAKTQAMETMRTVFAEYKAEIKRIADELGGYPQEDGNVVFPDASIAKMPKGLFIEPEHLVKFD